MNSSTVKVTSGLQPQLVDIGTIRPAPPFKDLFRVRPTVLESITADMRINGYDPAYPILIWDGTILDGHTRHQAAQAVNLTEVWAVPYNLADIEEALRVAISAQLDRRRALNDADVFQLVVTVDGVLPPQSGTTDGEKGGNTPDKTKELVGPYAPKVAKVRYIGKFATPEIRADLADGKITLSKAALACREIAGKFRKRTDGDQPKFGRITKLLDTAITLAKTDELATDLASLKVKCDVKLAAQEAAAEAAKQTAKDVAKAARKTAKAALKSGQMVSKPVVKNCGKTV